MTTYDEILKELTSRLGPIHPATPIAKAFQQIIEEFNEDELKSFNIEYMGLTDGMDGRIGVSICYSSIASTLGLHFGHRVYNRITHVLSEDRINLYRYDKPDVSFTADY